MLLRRRSFRRPKVIQKNEPAHPNQEKAVLRESTNPPAYSLDQTQQNISLTAYVLITLASARDLFEHLIGDDQGITNGKDGNFKALLTARRAILEHSGIKSIVRFATSDVMGATLVDEEVTNFSCI
jgi:hypothetical protein